METLADLESVQACLAYGTRLLKYDGSEVNVEDVKEGDLLLGPDGGKRTASNIVSGKEPLYRIKMNSKKEDLVVTSNHILVLHRSTAQKNKYEGPQTGQRKLTFEDRFGRLPEPSSEPGDGHRSKDKTKQRPDFMSALKSALAWMLAVDRGSMGAQRIRNILNGTTDIKAREAHYEVAIPQGDRQKVWATFAWGDSSRAGLNGHADYPPVFYPSKESAFAAAVAKSREVNQSGNVTLNNLRQRFLENSANGKSGRVKVDSGLPRLDLLWGEERSHLKFQVTAVVGGVGRGRSYRFPNFPSHALDDVQSDDDSDDDEESGLIDLPSVSAADQWETVEMTATQFANLDSVQRAKYRLFRSTGFDLPQQPVLVNPYFLGLWLGDGHRSSTANYNNHETEIRDFLASYAAELDLHLVHHGDLKYSIVGETRVGARALPTTVSGDSKTAVNFRAQRSARSSIIRQRLAAGWKINTKGDGVSWELPIDDVQTHVGVRSPQQQKGAKRIATSSPVRSDPLRAVSKRTMPLRSSPPPYASEPSIPEEPLSELRSDPDFMDLVGKPQVPQQEAEEDRLLDLIDVDGEDEEDVYNEELMSDDDMGDQDLVEEVGQRRNYRLQAGRRTYGDLQPKEEEHLADDLVQKHDGRSRVNTLLHALDQLGVRSHPDRKGPEADKKHIPASYMKNSRAVRLAVLAGLIDSDGSYTVNHSGSGSFRFTQSSRWHTRLFLDVVRIARSVGLTVATTQRDRTTVNGTSITELCAIISGNLHEIPCLLTRKQPLERSRAVSFNSVIQSVTLEPRSTAWASTLR